MIFAIALVPDTLSAQAPNTPNTASISGKVREDTGAAVRSIVTATSGNFFQRAFTGADGTFQFTKLPSGSYFLCAQTPLMSGPKDDPFIDSCAWPDLSSPRLALAAGQARIDVIVPVKRGYLLKIRVNDAGKLLTAPIGNNPASHLSLLLSGPAALQRNIPIADQDSAGRTHSIVIPYDTPHKLFIHSASLALKDANGRDFDGVTPIDVKVSRGGPPPVLVVNVVKAVKP